MDPYSSPYITTKNNPYNPFPHSLLSTREFFVPVSLALSAGPTRFHHTFSKLPLRFVEGWFRILGLGFRTLASNRLIIRVPFLLMFSLNKEPQNNKVKKGTTGVPRISRCYWDLKVLSLRTYVGLGDYNY